MTQVSSEIRELDYSHKSCGPLIRCKHPSRELPSTEFY